MITKLDYLKLAINSKVIENISWYISCFAIPILKETTNYDNKEIFEIVTKSDGLYYIDVDRSLIKINDYVRDEPLFKFKDRIDVDSTWNSFIKEKINTSIGTLIINMLILYPSFKGKLGYINEKIKVSTIENILSDKVVSDSDATENDITVSEMVDCMTRLGFLTNLANIINIAATEKAITPPKNIESIKKNLLKEYENELNNPVKLVEFENKLIEVDKEYLKDDPAAENIFNKKSKTARKKMFLIFGDTGDFSKSTEARTIKESLLEGINTSKEDFSKYINDLRIGSFSRGSSTQLGGYTYKILQRSLSGLSISNIPCDTKKGIVRYINKSNVNKLINRYIFINDDWILIKNKEEASKYLDKYVTMRSSMYCLSDKNSICYKCLSEVYKNSPTGITNIAAELSSVLLGMFMKLMHTTQIESTDIQLKDLIT